MYIQRTPAVFPLSFRLPPLLVMLARIVTFIRPDVSDRRQTELAPHLRYDVGEIDYDPDRISSLDKPNSYESQFWLHHDPRQLLRVVGESDPVDGSDVRPLTAGDVKMPVRDEREERLTRAGYLLVVGIDGFVRAVAAHVWSIARSAMKHGMIWLQIGSPEAGGRETQAAASAVNAPSIALAPSF